ncbi:DUF1127 domain-containing protein [Citreimonas sp.]|uniref:DUF1127 domain-containing protein n=1 Tax=Citreimonas sp. TaxID=3036715 RepID=UPI0035C79CD4
MIRTVAPTAFIPAYRPSGNFGLTVLRWIAVSRQRRDLAGLDARALNDIGITPGEAHREAARPFWDLDD